VDHEPVVDSGQDCVCLVAMQGDLRLNGLLGRIMQPFVRL
jgi:putative transcriptional regulator